MATGTPAGADRAQHGAGGLRRRWTVAFVVGEMVGFIPPAVAGTVLAARQAGDGAMVVGLTVAGALEGAALGMTQSRVLRRYVPALDGPRWVVLTAAAAAFAWFVGMSGPVLLGSDRIPIWAGLAVMVPAWASALLGMGFGQWLVLRRAIPRSARWIPVTAGAWLLGVLIPVAAVSLTPDATPAWARVAVAVASAVAMGVTVGMLTGGTLAGLIRARTTLLRASATLAP